MRVCIVERGGIASGTSGSGEGNILISDKSPGPDLEMALRGNVYWRQLAKTLPDQFEYDEKGAVVVAEDTEQLEALRSNVRALSLAGIEAKMLDCLELCDIEPYLARNVAGGAIYPGDAQVQPMLASFALVNGARREGAELFSHSEVVGIDRGGDGAITGVTLQTGTKIAAPRLVIAAGPWSAAVAAKAGSNLPVQPRKGHIVVTEAIPPLVRHKVFEAGYAGTVNSDLAGLQVAAVIEGTLGGTVLLGSSRQLVGFDRSIEVPVVRAIVRRAVRFFPVLASVRAIRAYIGFRAFTPDHLPLIGAVAEVPGLYVNTGHEGAGIGLGPISAKLLSQKMLGEAVEMDIEPFRPNRFAPTAA